MRRRLTCLTRHLSPKAAGRARRGRRPASTFSSLALSPSAHPFPPVQKQPSAAVDVAHLSAIRRSPQAARAGDGFCCWQAGHKEPCACCRCWSDSVTLARCSSPRGPSSGDWVRNQNASVPLLSIHSAQRSAGRTAACLHGSSRRLCLQWQRHVRQRARARGRGPAAGHRRQYFVRTPAQLRLPGSTEALLGTASTGAQMPCHAMLTVDVATHPPTQRTPHSGGICLMPAVHRPDQMVMSPAGPASSGRDRSLAAVTPTGGRPTSPSRVAVSKPASPHHLAAPGPGGRRTTRPGRRSGSVVTRRARRSLLRFYRPSV